MLHLCTDFDTGCRQRFEALLAMLKKGRGGLLRTCSECKQHIASPEPADMHELRYHPMHVCQTAECQARSST